MSAGLRPNREALLRSLWPALAALMGYGAWAYYINAVYEPALALRAGLIQGSYAFVLTLLASLLYEWLFAVLRNRALRKTLTVGAGLVLQLVTIVSIHLVAGTPAILATVTPGLLIGGVYAALYVNLLGRLEARQPAI